MSVHLEQDGVYLLPDALDRTDYVLVQAIQQGGAWQLVECHAVPFGSERFKQRANLPPDQLLRYTVDAAGHLIQQTPPTTQPPQFTIGQLSILGHLRDGRFVPAPEGL